MNIEDIDSPRQAAVKYPDSYRASIFQLACIATMGYILGNHNNIKSFGTEYRVEPENGENRVVPTFKIECAGKISIMLGDYGIGSQIASAIVYGEHVCISITYRFTHTITDETTISDIGEELYCLIMVLLHYDKIKLFEYRHCGPDNYMFAEQDLKDIMNEYDLADESAEVIELR